MPLTRGPDRGTGVAVAVDLVNTWDELMDEPDLIEGVRDVRYWIDWHGLHEAAKRIEEPDGVLRHVAERVLGPRLPRFRARNGTTRSRPYGRAERRPVPRYRGPQQYARAFGVGCTAQA